MIDGDEWDFILESKSFGKRQADQQRTEESGLGDDSDCMDIFIGEASLKESLIDNNMDAFEMFSRGDFRDNTAKGLMVFDLA